MLSARPHISGIILAGGRNTRMGREKALLKIGNKTIIEDQKDTLGKIFQEVIVVTNNLENFKNLDIKVVKDIVPDSGPLGGLYSGLSVSSNRHSFLIGCDMPFINVELVKYMIAQIGENDIVVPFSSRGIETFFAIYSFDCLETIRRQIESQNLVLYEILDFHKVRYITPEEIRKFDPQEFSFFNVNSPRDFEEAKKIWQER